MEETIMVDLNATLERLTAAAEALERAVAKQNEVAVAAQANVARIVAEADNRKTLTAGTAMMLTKQGIDAGSVTLEAGALDAALTHLSVEQRIAVKAELMRAGLLG